MKKRMETLFRLLLIVSVMMSMMSVPAFAESAEMACGLAEHTHSESCYTTTVVCEKHVCTEEACETPAYQDKICTDEEHAHSIADDCYHKHAEKCYAQLCEKTTETVDCGKTEGELVCTKDISVLTCGKDEVLACPDAETEGHECSEEHVHNHGPSCYHAHKEETNCYHKHDTSCNHVHGSNCYAAEPSCGKGEEAAAENLECDTKEHVHGNTEEQTCYVNHIHGDACYKTELTCDITVHTHTGGCVYGLGVVAVIGETPYTDLKTAVGDANSASGEDTVTIVLVDDVYPDKKMEVTGNIVITGNSVIYRNASYLNTLFDVKAGATLTLDGITIDGNNNWTFLEDEFRQAAADGIRTSNADVKYLVLEEGAPVATGTMITVNGKVVLDGGTVIKNHVGCALFAVSAGAALETNDATITHNTRGGSPVVASVSGDGNWIINEGAVISGNHCEAGNGVISYMSGTCIMNGGEIYGNTGEDCNGCVMMLYGGKSSFTMNGGHIYDNGATYGSNNGWNPAFYVYGNGAKFTMNDGVIEGNYSESIPGIANNGSNALITLNGGKILNTITGRGFTAKDVYTYAPTVVSNEVNSATNGFYNNVTNTGVLNGDSWFYSNEMTYSGGGTFNGNVTVQSGAETTMMDGSWVNGIVYVKAVGNDSTLTVKPEAVINGIQVRVLNSVESGDCENASEASAAQEAAYVEEDGAKVDSPVLYYHRLTSAQKQNIVVTYDYNGGLDEYGWSGTQVTTADVAYTPSVEELSKPFLAGYKLVGWNYAAEDNQDPESLSMEGEEVYYTSGSETVAELTETIRLIAQWEPVETDSPIIIAPVNPTPEVKPEVKPEEKPEVKPEEQGPLVEIEDDKVPLEGLEDSDVPQAGFEEVEEEETPLTDVPKTGDSNNMMLWLAMAALSAIALLTMRLTEKKEY